MKKTIKKSELLPAMETILQEYKDKTHDVNANTCKLCLLYYGSLPHCISCPMKVFGKNTDKAFSCMERKCDPVRCDSFLRSKRLQRVIEFYEKTIEGVKLMTYKQLNKKDAFNFLIKNDEEVAKKYHIQE
jgi:hypothetical protein